ncbi:MAG: hypothetical protein J6J79_09785 [Lachnospiraceae bacterium]|nr:hypothetical protein [Lachnospiraceae bacterium]
MTKEVKKEYVNQFISMAEIVYLIYFIVMFGTRAIGIYEGMLAYNVSLVIGMLIFGLKVLMTEHSVLEYIMMAGLLLLCLIVYRNTGEKGMLLYFTMMLGMKGVSVQRVFKTGAIVQVTAFVALVVLSLLGIKEEIIYVQSRMGMGEVLRHALGYPHPNTLHTTYVCMMVLIMYAFGNKNRKRLVVTSGCLFLGSVYIYLYSCSNTGLLVSVLYLAVNFYFQSRKTLSKFEKICIYSLYPACLLFSILGPIIIKGKLFDIINKLLNTRWGLSVYYLQNEPVTLFGTRFKEAPTTQYMIDSSFLYSFLQLGIIAFLVITVLYLLTIHECVKNRKRAEIAIIVSFCIMGISDPFLFNLSYKNLVFLFIGAVWYCRVEDVQVNTLLKKKIRILRIGGNEIKYRKIMLFSSYGKAIQLIAVFAIAAIVSGGFYAISHECPNAVYINQTAWEKGMSLKGTVPENLEDYALYLSDDDVAEIEETNGLVIGYQNENKPMFMEKGNVAKMEYIRNIISIGVWSGVLAVLVLCGVKLRKA